MLSALLQGAENQDAAEPAERAAIRVCMEGTATCTVKGESAHWWPIATACHRTFPHLQGGRSCRSKQADQTSFLLVRHEARYRGFVEV